MRKLVWVTLAVAFATGSLVESASAKSRTACTKEVKSKEQYLTPGGRCGENCRAAIELCVKNKKF